ncbi:MAG: phosphoribosylaminoimidazolesuccinocarboxamide synthase [Lentisphaerota bacterium]
MQTLTSLELKGVKKFKSGKVREVFDLDEALLVVATDRISAFDCILPSGIPDKGNVLNQLSAWWFSQTRQIIPNHMITCDVTEYPKVSGAERVFLKGRSMLVKKAQALPVECVVRGYLIGSGWKEYQQTGVVSGIPLRPGYIMASKLEEPIFTPARKAETGHDENISFEQTVQMLGTDVAGQLRNASLKLYRFAADYALKKGIIIADTKFEFGIVDGNLVLIDEALTPDSSRFWPSASYAPGSSPASFDKQFVRDYLETLDWDKTPPAPPLPEEVIMKTRGKYVEAFKLLTGKDLL